jgi:hypothetical protein
MKYTTMYIFRLMRHVFIHFGSLYILVVGLLAVDNRFRLPALNLEEDLHAE